MFQPISLQADKYFTFPYLETYRNNNHSVRACLRVRRHSMHQIYTADLNIYVKRR